MAKTIQDLTLIALAGPPGSGKSRLGVELEKVLGAGRVLAGETLRKIAEEDSELGRFVHSFTSTRHLVPGDLLGKVMKAKLEEFVGKKDIVVIDGYPRNMDQLKIMDTISMDLRWVVIQVPVEECRRRIASASDRGLRLDDRHEAVKEKGFIVYEQETKPMIDFIEGRKKGSVLDVDGMQTPEEIAETVRKYFSK